MKTLKKEYSIPLLVLVFCLGIHQPASAQATPTVKPLQGVFPTGNKITNNNFTGTAYLQSLIEADSLNAISVGNVTFTPGARSKWHLHPAGQILLVTDGVGYYQERGQPKKILHKGDVVKCPPNTPHWHGASATKGFVQVAITSRERGETVWMEAVTDKEYHQ